MPSTISRNTIQCVSSPETRPPSQPPGEVSLTRVLRARATARSLARDLLSTDDSRSLLLQRVTLGVVVLAHGAQKLVGAFGGWGFESTVRWFSEALGVPAPLSVIVILAESLGAVALVLGAFTRVAALGVVAVMLGAIALVHAPHGLFMNWSGAQAGEGYEFHLLALALAVPLVFRGAGAGSLDRWLVRSLRLNAP
jgi:putative oxidoreductase